MIVRNGIRATIRARGRTALFALLIFALTLTLTLGGGMWAYCAETLARMDAQYTSIALLEYIGEDYPSAHTADEEVRAAAAAMDAAAMRAVSGVTLYEPTDRTLAWTEGYQHLSTEAPYGDYGVIVVSSLSPQYQTAWREISVEELPQERLVIDYLTYTLSVRSGSMEYTDIPFYYYGFINEIGSVCYFYFEEDGSTVQVEVEDLPLLLPPCSLTVPKIA